MWVTWNSSLQEGTVALVWCCLLASLPSMVRPSAPSCLSGALCSECSCPAAMSAIR